MNVIINIHSLRLNRAFNSKLIKEISLDCPRLLSNSNIYFTIDHLLKNYVDSNFSSQPRIKPNS